VWGVLENNCKIAGHNLCWVERDLLWKGYGMEGEIVQTPRSIIACQPFRKQILSTVFRPSGYLLSVELCVNMIHTFTIIKVLV